MNLQFHWMKGATKPWMALATTPRGNTTGEGQTWLEAMKVAIERSIAVGDIDPPKEAA